MSLTVLQLLDVRSDLLGVFVGAIIQAFRFLKGQFDYSECFLKLQEVLFKIISSMSSLIRPLI